MRRYRVTYAYDKAKGISGTIVEAESPQDAIKKIEKMHQSIGGIKLVGAVKEVNK